MPIILIIVGLFLIVYSYIALKKESTYFEIKDISERKEENKSFGQVLEKNKDELNDYKIELGLFRKNVAESLTELQEEILEIKKYLNMVKNDENLYENEIEEENLNIDDDNKGVISEINFNRKHNNSKISDSKKTESIKNLLEQGLSDDEICLKLSISKGEVLLVKDLFKK
ncbi:MAG: hypothetical protein ACI398_05490 [Clostridium sp.]